MFTPKEFLDRMPPVVREPVLPDDGPFAREVAARRNRYRGYSRRRDRWGRGLLGDALSPVEKGTLGEIGFARWLTRELGVLVLVDVSDRPNGDPGYDFVVAGYRHQLKTGVSDYADLLVPTDKAAAGRSDIFVRPQWFPDAIELYGWVWDTTVLASEKIPAFNGNHKNYRVRPDKFFPMTALVNLLAVRLKMNPEKTCTPSSSTARS